MEPISSKSIYWKWKQKQKNSTPQEFKDWAKSPEGLRFKCGMEGYDPKRCGEELHKLAEIAELDNEHMWLEALAQAMAYYRKELYADVRKLEHCEAETQLAERYMLEAGYAPPHWKGTAKCSHCGTVIVSARDNNKNLVGCPWCNTKAGKLFNEILKGDSCIQ